MKWAENLARTLREQKQAKREAKQVRLTVENYKKKKGNAFGVQPMYAADAGMFEGLWKLSRSSARRSSERLEDMDTLNRLRQDGTITDQTYWEEIEKLVQELEDSWED